MNETVPFLLCIGVSAGLAVMAAASTEALGLESPEPSARLALVWIEHGLKLDVFASRARRVHAAFARLQDNRSTAWVSYLAVLTNPKPPL